MTECRRFLVIAFACLVLAAFGYFLWSRPAPAPQGPGASAAAPGSDPAASPLPPAPGRAASAAGKRKPEPLPPPGAPVAQIVGPLQARADAGDSRAACRLAIELLRCQHIGQSREIQWFNDQPPDVSLAKGGNLDMADRYAEMEIRNIRLGQQCEAVDPALVSQAAHYLAAAAHAGEPEAMLRYATGEHHGILGEKAFIRDPDFERWRRDAPALLLRAVQAGRADAVHALGYAYRSDGSPYAGLIPDDPLQAHAWAVLHARLSGAPTPAFEADDAAVEVEANALAAQWHQRYFDNAVLGRGAEALQPTSLHASLKAPEDQHFCE